MSLVLHSYWRSSAAYRVRIALNLKGLDHRLATHDLRRGENREAAYRALAPQGLIPALEADGVALVQSPAILEWLEERYPEPPLLPRDADSRAIVRAMAALVACDIHPINNLRVLNALRGDFGADDATVTAWIGRWIGEGFAALETLVARHGGAFAFGDRPTFADCMIVPQVYSAERFGVDLSAYPGIVRVDRATRALDAVREAHPQNQPDADPG